MGYNESTILNITHIRMFSFSERLELLFEVHGSPQNSVGFTKMALKHK